LRVSAATWLFALVVTVLCCAASIRWIDYPVAYLFESRAKKMSGLGEGLSSSVLLSSELILIAFLGAIRLVRGRLPEYGKLTFVATCASLISFEVNDFILKVFFGRQAPGHFLQTPIVHVFDFMHGDDHTSFPSGHMAMATAFAAVVLMRYSRVWPIFAFLLSVSGAALIVGEWHFVSDVIAGTFVGGTMGLAGFRVLQRYNAYKKSSVPNI
jgi:membrane-associated phospholipid phosphatase